MPTSSIRFEKWGARSVSEWGLHMIIGKTTSADAIIERIMQSNEVINERDSELRHWGLID